jgi:hypothetical protein
VIGGNPPCPLAAETPPVPTGKSPPIGSPITPFADTMRRLPVFSVINKSPLGSGSTAQGLFKPFATTVTSKAVSDFAAQARVCPGKAGFCSGAFAVLVSSGAQLLCALFAISCVLFAESEVLLPEFGAGFCAQTVVKVVRKIVKINPVRFRFISLNSSFTGFYNSKYDNSKQRCPLPFYFKRSFVISNNFPVKGICHQIVA